MAIVVQKAFPPGRYRVGGATKEFTREELSEYARDTVAAMQAGIEIPALKKHASPGADDSETMQFAATDGAGWLKNVTQDDGDGALVFHLDVPEEIEAGIKNSTIKFTSPEFRPTYTDGTGRNHGKVIRHIAFTPFPRNPNQEPLAIAMSEAIQCSEADYEGPMDEEEEKNKKPEGDEQFTTVADPPANPDAPPTATDKTKAEALRACFSQLGAELTSDWSLDKPGAVDELLAVLKTLVKSKSEAETKSDPVEMPEAQEASMPFTEEELAAMPAAKRDRLKKMQSQALQFTEERAARIEAEQTAKRNDAVAKVKSAAIPAGLKAKLVGRLESLQFSEGKEPATLTVSEVAMLFSEAMPPELRGSFDAANESGHPEGETFFNGDPSNLTDEEADLRADEQLKRTGFDRRGSQGFKWENPNELTGGSATATASAPAKTAAARK